jgi:hypothetical protein
VEPVSACQPGALQAGHAKQVQAARPRHHPHSVFDSVVVVVFLSQSKDVDVALRADGLGRLAGQLVE